MNHLLDANGLIALLDPDHKHHDRVHRYFARRRFGVTPLVQLAALRHATRDLPGRPARTTPAEARRMLRVTMNQRAKFVPEDVDVAGAAFDRVTGHLQWNDHYLCAVAARHGLRLATCDEPLARAFPAAAVLIPA